MNPPTAALAPLEIEVVAGLDADGTPVVRLQWQHHRLQGTQLVAEARGIDLCPTLAQTVADQLNEAIAALAAATKKEKTP